MRHRIVSSRVLIKAHPNHIYKLLENLENHRQLWPGVSSWQGDRDSARYRWQLGLASFNVETRVVERMVGTRICEEPVSGAPFPYRRWFKVQAEDQSSVCEISLEGEMSRLQIALFHPAIKGQLEAILRKLKAVMEQPKAAPGPTAPASPAAAAPAAAGAPSAPPASKPPASTPPTAASS